MAFRYYLVGQGPLCDAGHDIDGLVLMELFEC